MPGRFILSTCVFLSGLAILAHPILAQTDFQKQIKAKGEAVANELKISCDDDLKKYCSQVTPGEARTVFCMLAHEDRISDRCTDAVVDLADKIELKMSKLARAAIACEDDLKRECDPIRAGRGRLVQCMRDHKDKLSALCQSELIE